MEVIKFLSEGTGFMLMVLILAAILVLFFFLISRTSYREYRGRLSSALLFIEIAIVFGITALGFPKKGDEVGPGVVPLLWVAGILGLGILLFIRALLRAEEKDPEWGNAKAALTYILLTVGYLLIMQYIGYTIATILFLILGMSYLTYRNWKVMIIICASWIVFSYLTFYKLLYVPLPKGILIERIFG